MRFESLLKIVAAAFFVTIGASQAHAICDEERAAFLEASANFIENEGERLQNCDDLRICKRDSRILKKECKQTLEQEIFACFQECRDMRGSAKRQCKQDCRTQRKIGKMTCRNLKALAVADCRDESPECIASRTDAVKLGLSGVAATVNFYQCLRKNGVEAENEEEKEEVEDAEAAAEAAEGK